MQQIYKFVPSFVHAIMKNRLEMLLNILLSTNGIKDKSCILRHSS